MSTQVEDRVFVGECDMGNVFIFHFASTDAATGAPANHQWRVEAGNHTITTVDSEERARAVAIALCGEGRLDNAFVGNIGLEPETAPAPEPEVAPAPEPEPEPEPEPVEEPEPAEEVAGEPA